jgi:hypothetical protein
MEDLESALRILVIVPLSLFLLHFFRKRRNMTLRILLFLEKDLKTKEEICEHLELQPFEISSALEFLATVSHCIQRVFRGPWDKEGNKQNPYAYSITTIGIRCIANPNLLKKLEID